MGIGEILLDCFLFLVGLALIVKGGDVFVDGASFIAKALKVPTFIIGATIVSVATTLPEMIVSVMSALDGSVEMAIGNAVGSVTANVGLIMAIAMVCMNIVCPRKKYIVQCLLLVASCTVLFLSSLGGELNVFGGIVLFLIFLGFMTFNVVSAKREIQNATEGEEKVAVDKKELIKNILFFVCGAGAIVGGSRLMVDYGQIIAKDILGVPERIVALTLVAIGTSLPELVTTITAIVKKESALSVGNVIGANIIDLSLILPACSLFSGKAIAVPAQSLWIDIPVCLGVILVALIPMIWKQKAYKAQGVVLILGYLSYIVFSCLL